MFSITVLAVGKLKEAFFLKACEEYRKRLGSYCSISIVELPENRLSDRPSAGEIEAALLREAEEIEKRIPKNCIFCDLYPGRTATFVGRVCGKAGITEEKWPFLRLLFGWRQLWHCLVS